MSTVGTGKIRRPLNDKQRMTLRLVHESICKRGRPPSARELSEVLGDSIANATFKLRTLVARKLLEKTGSGPHRGLRVTDAGYSELQLPTPTDMRIAVERAERYRGLLVRCWSLLTQIAPLSPLLGEVRDALSVDDKVDTTLFKPPQTNGHTNGIAHVPPAPPAPTTEIPS